MFFSRILLLLLVTHTHAAPLGPQIEQRELHNEAKMHHRFAAWAESHGWHHDAPHHEQNREHHVEHDDNMLSAAPALFAASGEEASPRGDKAACHMSYIQCISLYIREATLHTAA
jgi:Ni/Co efflux regulator RcnB